MPKVKASLSNDDRIEKMQELLSGDEASEEAEAEVNKKRLSELRNLIFLGKLKESIEIGGFVFSLTTLSASEQGEVVRHLMKTEEIDRLLHSKAIALSYCIEKINGVPLSDLSEESEGEDESERKVSFILQMQSSLVDRIYLEYEKLVERSAKEVDFDSLKK